MNQGENWSRLGLAVVCSAFSEISICGPEAEAAEEWLKTSRLAAMALTVIGVDQGRDLEGALFRIKAGAKLPRMTRWVQ